MQLRRTLLKHVLNHPIGRSRVNTNGLQSEDAVLMYLFQREDDALSSDNDVIVCPLPRVLAIAAQRFDQLVSTTSHTGYSSLNAPLPGCSSPNSLVRVLRASTLIR